MQIIREQSLSTTATDRILKLIQNPSFDPKKLPKTAKSAKKVEDNYLPPLVYRLVVMNLLANHCSV